MVMVMVVLRDSDDFGGVGEEELGERYVRRREQGGDGKEEVGLNGVGLRYVAVPLQYPGKWLQQF